MFAMTLDPKRSHEHNPNCPMRLTLAPDGRSWMCVDCGITIMWKRVDWHQLKQSVRAVAKMLENVQDHHGVAHRAKELLELELERLEVGEPSLAERMGAVEKACHGRPPITVPEREHVAGMGSDPHEGGTR